MITATRFRIATLDVDLQIFATTGTTVIAGPGAPKRYEGRPTNAAPIDLTVTPATGPVSGQVGGIGANEMIYLTGNNALAGLSTPGVSNANAASMVGVANGQYPYLWTDGVYAQEPASSPVGATPYLEFFEEGDFLFNTTSANSYSPFTLVYLGADGRTISTTATGTKVGYASLDQRGVGGVGIGQYAFIPTFPITGASGVFLYVRVQPAKTNPNG